LICSRRSAGVAGKVAICASARLNLAVASASADGRFDEARLREVMRQQLWLGRSAADHVIA
jgi:hypothetical protein